MPSYCDRIVFHERPASKAKKMSIYTTLIVYAEVVKTALEPEKGSVPACKLVITLLEATPWLVVRYLKNKFKSAAKLPKFDGATKENTVVSPLGPLNSFHFVPAIVGVARGVLPVDEIGPAPPYEPTQIIISYALLAPTEGASQRS